MKKYFVIIVLILLVSLITVIGQYIETFKNENVSAATVGIPNPGHTWSSMECSANSLCIDTANNRVGIGTNTPTKKLEVAGDIKVSGDICNSNGKCLNQTTATDCGSANNLISSSTPSANLCTNGTASLVTSNSIPPDNLMLYLPADSNFNDSAKGKTVTNNGATISNTNYKLGGGSMYFNGSSYLSIPNSTDWNFGTGNFTVDFWVYLPSVTTRQALIGQRSGDSYNTFNWFIYLATNSTAVFDSYNGSTEIAAASTPVISANTWTHLAFVRKENTVTAYANGIGGTPVAMTGAPGANAINLTIGNFTNSATGATTGYIDEVRVSKGFALWTSNFNPLDEGTKWWEWTCTYNSKIYKCEAPMF